MILLKMVLLSLPPHSDITRMVYSQLALRQARAGPVIRFKLQSHVFHPQNTSSLMQPGTFIPVPS